jgi:hypothetical protein
MGLPVLLGPFLGRARVLARREDVARPNSHSTPRFAKHTPFPKPSRGRGTRTRSLPRGEPRRLFTRTEPVARRR